jgi:hypothetical protein
MYARHCSQSLCPTTPTPTANQWERILYHVEVIGFGSAKKKR